MTQKPRDIILTEGQARFTGTTIFKPDTVYRFQRCYGQRGGQVYFRVFADGKETVLERCKKNDFLQRFIILSEDIKTLNSTEIDEESIS